MTQEESNKLIAEFMGGEYTPYPDGMFPGEYGYKFSCKIPSTQMYDENWWNQKALKFHSSWDWLMPVVEKIESLGCNIQIGINHYCMIALEKETADDEFNYYKFHTSTEQDPISGKVKSKIDGLYLCIVEFIQWYNTNNNH